MSSPIESLLSPAAASSPSRYVDFPEFEIKWAFEAGLPDPATFPIDDLVRISERVLRDDAEEALQYGTPRQSALTYGFAGLREEIIARTPVASGRDFGLPNVMLTGGGVQGITFACRTFLEPGDLLAVEAPTWNAVLSAAEQAGASTLAIPMDDDGMIVDVLEERLVELEREGRRLKMVYTIDTFNTPTGLCLSEPRRRRLIELAAHHGFVILEDNVYGALRYDGRALPTMFEMDTTGLVVKIDSFSKTLAPALRLGWVSADPTVISAMAGVRGDLGVSQWIGRIMAGYLNEGLYEPHLEKVNSLYRTKRDLTDAALTEHCGDLVTWRKPDGGFFFWVEMDRNVDTRAVMGKALAEGVVCRPGERFFGQPDSGARFLRIAFTMVPAERIPAGIEVLARAMSDSTLAGTGA